MGEIAVPLDAYWGAQTQRSVENCAIGEEKMPYEITRAFSYLKKAVALVNRDLGKLDEKKAYAIAQAADEMLEGNFQKFLPSTVLWYTTHKVKNYWTKTKKVVAQIGNHKFYSDKEKK